MTARRIYRTSSAGDFAFSLIGSIPNNTGTSFTDRLADRQAADVALPPGTVTDLKAVRSPAMNRRNALFAGHNEGGLNWARFASLIGTCKMNGVKPYAYLRDLFTRLANGHLANKDIDALMPWAYAKQIIVSQ